MWHGFRWLVGLSLLTVSFACGNGDEPAELFFRVVDGSADGLVVPGDVDRFTLTVSSLTPDGGVVRFMDGWPLAPTDGSPGAGITLPDGLSVFPLDPTAPERSTIRCELSAYRGPIEILRYPVITGFGIGQVVHDMPIDPACFGNLCADGERCESGRCVPLL